MNNNRYLKSQLAQWLFIFLISLTFFLSLLFLTKNLLFIFIGAFAILYWQRERIRSWLQPVVAGRSPLMSFLITSLLWAFFFETTLRRSNIHPNLLLSFLMTLGFYLPYFLVWYKIFQSRAFSLMQVFYLAGVSGALFQLLITKQIVATFTQAPDVPTGLLFSILRIASVITFAGSLTTFPFIVLGKEEKEVQPKLGMCLLGLSSYFIALIGYLVLAGAIKRLVI